MSLTKSEFLSFGGCPKRAWLSRNRPDLRAPIDEGLSELFESGRRLTELARTMFPGGVSMPEGGSRASQSAATERALAEGIETLFEAAFDCGGMFARVDVLVRRDGGWALFEVKSSASVKPEHISDVAFQWSVLAGAGLEVVAAYVVHVNTAAVFDGDPLGAEDLLVAEDVTSRVEKALERTLIEARSAMETVGLAEAPEIETNKPCKECVFHGHCHEDQDPLDIALLPVLSSQDVTKLRAEGKRLASDLVGDPPRKGVELAVSSLVEGVTKVSEGLAEEVARIEFPASFVDFEAANPMHPVVPGLRPYEVFVFQWSCHFLDHPLQETPTHKEFLDVGAVDPRAGFAETLWEALRHCRTVVHYSPYETIQVRKLPASVSGRVVELQGLFERSAFDLLPVVKGHVYDPGFMGEYSIKKVLPALVPGMDYKDETIADGQAAARAYLLARSEGTTAEESARLVHALKSYCSLDTLAMVQLYKKLRSLAGG